LNKISQFWQELKRRKVIRLIIIYAPSAFILLEVFDIFSDNYGFPSWAFNLLLAALILAFVVLLILSWIFDFTPEGWQRTSSLEDEQRKEKTM
jgi:hypothetical protein